MDSTSEILDESMLDVIQRAEAFIMAHSLLNRGADRSSSNIFDISDNDESFHSAADKSAIEDNSGSDMSASGPSISRTSDSDDNPQASNVPLNAEVLSDDSDATLSYDLVPLSSETDDNADCVVIEEPSPVVDLCSPMYDEVPLPPAARRARRRRADNAPVVESINLDDTVIDAAPPKRITTTASSTIPNYHSVSTESAPTISARCPICLESIFHQQAASTICGHLFCNACITQEIRIRNKCPMCKRVLKKHQVHPIYLS